MLLRKRSLGLPAIAIATMLKRTWSSRKIVRKLMLLSEETAA